MGYLQKSGGIANFSKAVISVWFRVPQASITAAAAQYDNLDIADFPFDWNPNFAGMIPLITFGANASIRSEPNFNSPSFIGVNCGAVGQQAGRDPADKVSLVMHFQYSTGSAAVAGAGAPIVSDYFQVGYLGKYPNTFASSVSPTISLMEVTPDAWHHALISFDFSGGCSSSLNGGSNNLGVTYDSVCKIWCAFDDVNRNKTYLWPTNANSYLIAAGDNDVVSLGCLGAVGGPGVGSSYSFAAGNLPTAGNPIAFPCDSTNTSTIYQVEMSELQIFTGVTLDTSNVTNRRAFVTADGNPEDSAVAQALLGKAPDILLHGSQHWIDGVNTGTAGSFLRTGTVNVYSPGPSL